MSKFSENTWGSMIFDITLPEASTEVPRNLWPILIFPELTQEEVAEQTQRTFDRLKPALRELAQKSGLSLERYMIAVLDSTVKKRRIRSKK